MADYNRVQIETLYLTDDGTVSGTPCLVTVSGLASLRPAKRQTVIQCIGVPQVQLFDNLIGESFTMNVFLLGTTQYESLITAIDAAHTAGDTMNVVIEGELGDFDLECVLESISQPGEFSTGRIPSVEMVFRIAGVNE